ncbi:glycosyltransferase family 4 protein [Micrococcus luteus]|uniref:glycosyltransferase family 4 protein n=1 Tax=Micrococcus TaxID=1269 RepID=UPI0019D28428|nr:MULTISPECIES: glycosyltransferase family 4 protein [Micrococcus]MCV7522697.1 glycosyltransferase family 4 protein [Micrococcus luteus]MCV7674073.1 glycosyltransferase family 4 protein [Micrococcus luteus]MCV7696607.1 glycosyltransferase family 4 protein [Micrococcus luteus]
MKSRKHTMGADRQARPRTVEGRILHLSSAHPWTDNRIHLREASALAKAGMDVGLVAVDNDLSAVETGVRVVRTAPRGRLGRMTLGAVSALRAAVRSRAQVVHLHDPELIWTVPVLQALGRTVVYDAHEDLPSQVMHKPYIHPVVRTGLAAVSSALLRVADRADLVVAATETVAERFDPSHTVVVRNFPQAVPQERAIVPVSRRPLTAVYVGGLSEARGTGDLVAAAGSEAWPEGWTLSMAGPGAGFLVDGLKAERGWSRVEHHGLVAPLDARRLVAEARVGLVVLRDTPNHRLALPTKMFEYMAAGTPVIASDFPLWRSILERYDCGILVDAGDPEQIASAVRRYAEDPEFLERHSANALHAYRTEVNWEAESRVLVAAYEAL